MAGESIIQKTAEYYTEKLRLHGPTARGVDWNSEQSQHLRFRQLMKIRHEADHFSINDYGCGYGALSDFLLAEGLSFVYTGFDISEAMIRVAGQSHAGLLNCRFTSDESTILPADYTVASGIFNVRLDVEQTEWAHHMYSTLERVSDLSSRGFAFNVLTSYSDIDRMRPDLYYADPCVLFDFCKRRFSRNVALLHDYDLFEFTILVRKQLP